MNKMPKRWLMKLNAYNKKQNPTTTDNAIETEKVAKIFKDSVASFYAYYMFTHEDNYYYHFKSKLNGTYIKLEKPNAWQH